MMGAEWKAGRARGAETKGAEWMAGSARGAEWMAGNVRGAEWMAGSARGAECRSGAEKIPRLSFGLLSSSTGAPDTAATTKANTIWKMKETFSCTHSRNNNI